MIILCDTDICCGSWNLFVLWFMYCYLLFLLLLDCWFCDIFFSFLDAGFWRITNSRDPSLPRCPRFQISRPCKLPGAFLYPWLFTSFMIAGHIGWFFLFCLFHLPLCFIVHTTGISFCDAFFFLMLPWYWNAHLFLWNRDLAQNKLTGDIPRLIYWNEVLQYL